MAKFGSIPSKTIKLFIILCHLSGILGTPTPWTRPKIHSLENYRLRNDSHSLQFASKDYGNLVHEIPSAVLYPSSIQDIIQLVKSSNNRPLPFTIAARGHAHSVRGQAMARDGVVVDMASLNKPGAGIRVSTDKSLGFYYADVGGEQLWIDVLRVTLKHGLAPVSRTDYLYLTVGGTLSNAGISGESFLHGPQISNVLELDVITGKGEFITCSRNRNPELFFGVLGGLGQFGIITRARIILDKAPTRAKWIRLVYNNFTKFPRDQELLISGNVPNYIEGSLITNQDTIQQWRSSFSSPSNQSDIVSLLEKQSLIYSIELAKYYDNQTASSVDEEIRLLIEQLNFIPNFIFEADVSFFDFINRVGNLDSPSAGSLLAHPWLNLFIPKSRIQDFNDGALVKFIPTLHENPEIYIFYPFNITKWNARMSANIPEEDVFYTLGLLHGVQPNDAATYDEINNQILEFCQNNGIEVKQYLPHYHTKEDWIKHFGSKWDIFQERKNLFDPKNILSPGQRIFN